MKPSIRRKTVRVPEKPFIFTPPTSEQMWACLQRCLAFEDPAARFERLQNILRKHLTDEALKNRDVASLPLNFQDAVFNTVYGLNGTANSNADLAEACVILNIVLALEDIARFTEIAFDSWKVAVPVGAASKDLSKIFPDVGDDPEISQLAKQLSLTGSQELWLQHARRAVPNWAVLSSPGPWSSDGRVNFLNGQLRRFSGMKAEAAGFRRALEMFQPQLDELRPQLPGNFLPRLILLVEGETEAILVPHFASLLGYDFNKMGVMLVSAGGGKQVARRYFELRDVVSLPIVLFTDADAGEEVEVAAEALRDNDRLHIWKNGEIEDTLDTETLVQQLNTFLQTSGAPGYVSTAEFPNGQRRTVILNRLWRARGLGNFDKIGFAEVVAGNLKDRAQVPADVAVALNVVSSLLKNVSKQGHTQRAGG